MKGSLRVGDRTPQEIDKIYDTKVRGKALLLTTTREKKVCVGKPYL